MSGKPIEASPQELWKIIARQDGSLARLEDENERLRAALREDRKYLAGLCGCAASSGCGAAIRRAEIDRLLKSLEECAIETLVSDPDEGLPTAEDVRGILKPGKNER